MADIRPIDANALKEEIVKMCEHINANNGIAVPTLVFTCIIDNAPTVDAIVNTIEVRPQGEWIFMRGVTCGGYYKCNRCGEVERAEKNYCHNCGARMKGGKE